MVRQIILDTETTGLEPKEGHRIIEIGCIELVHRRFTGNNFHFYLNPERDIDEGALKVHGISNTFLLNKPRFADIYTSFLEYINNAELIIHNAPFDIGFLNHEFALLNLENKIEQLCEIIDTLALARQLHPGQRNSLDALCKRYSVDNTDRALHGALLDAKILAYVYLAMTGGQSSLFDASPELEQQNVRVQSTIRQQEHWHALPVVYASKEEITKHNAYLNILKQNSGQCLWPE